jgi:hypothetical protein
MIKINYRALIQKFKSAARESEFQKISNLSVCLLCRGQKKSLDTNPSLRSTFRNEPEFRPLAPSWAIQTTTLWKLIWQERRRHLQILSPETIMEKLDIYA